MNNKYHIILTNADGSQAYVEALQEDGRPKLGPKNLALKTDFKNAIAIADVIKNSGHQCMKLTISEVRD